METGAAVLVPVKAFAQAKLRLAGALSPTERHALARRLAAGVVAAAGALPVTIACDDDEVASWARALGCDVAWTPGLGLNGAVTAGVEVLAAAGVDRVIVAHADLPFATDLAPLLVFDGITLVPDRRDDGTNVVVLPAGCGFTFSYGPGSFARHVAEARRHPHALHIARRLDLGWDVDVPSDLPVEA